MGKLIEVHVARMSAKMMETLAAELPKHPDVTKKVNAVFQWDIKTGSGVDTWTMDLKAGKIEKGAAAKADCTIAVAEDDFLSMISGKGNSQAMFMQGKLKIKGNMMLAMKLGELTKLVAK